MEETDTKRLVRRWIALILISAALAGLLELARLPAGLLLGPMVAGIAMSVRGRGVQVPHPLFVGAQALVGCLIAAAMTMDIVTTTLRDWPLFLAVNAATMIASSVLGYVLSRWQVLPGTVAIWGSTPGAATAMVLMAQAYGADSRLVAVMTYTRVVCVAVGASILAAAIGGSGGNAAVAWLAEPPLHVVLGTVAVAAIGAVGGLRLRIPAGALIGPILLGGALNVAGILRPQPPQLLLALAYAIVGWRIGLSFTRETVAAAARAMPRIVLAALLLIGFCAALSWLVARETGLDPVTAYLATSPGGMDSVAIIAASTNVDVPFVMAMQMARFVIVLLAGPAFARWVARRRQEAPQRGG